MQCRRLRAADSRTDPLSWGSRGNASERAKAMTGLIIWLIIGAIAGWLAGVIVKGAGFGLLGNIVLGIIGAIVAGWLFPRLGIVIGSGFIADVISAAIGAIIVLVIVVLVKRAA
jgi:uncharacterized membrane protein YeaQ/YmgE (transglycosylase-associated protein family)